MAAVNKGLAVVGTCRADNMCKVYSVGVDSATKSVELELTDRAGLEKAEEPWVKYPAAVVRRLVMNFGINKGGRRARYIYMCICIQYITYSSIYILYI